MIITIMRKITDAVKDILYASEPELTALSRRVLNLSAYAKRIQPEVERRTLKPVQVGSIVVALSRLAADLSDEDPLLPKIELDSIAVKTGLVEIAFDKTAANKARAQKVLSEPEFTQADFLTIIYGVSEIAVFTSRSLAPPILKKFKPEKPKLHLDDLAALTVQFGQQYIEIPNMYFALFRALAVRRINIVEVVSTFTELTFLVAQQDLNELFSLMNSLMRIRQANKNLDLA